MMSDLSVSVLFSSYNGASRRCATLWIPWCAKSFLMINGN